MNNFPIAQMVKNLPAMKEPRVWSLGQKDPLEKGTAIHSSNLAWIPWTEKPGGLQSMGSQRVRLKWATNIHTHTHTQTSITLRLFHRYNYDFPAVVNSWEIYYLGAGAVGEEWILEYLWWKEFLLVSRPYFSWWDSTENFDNMKMKQISLKQFGRLWEKWNNASCNCTLFSFILDFFLPETLSLNPERSVSHLGVWVPFSCLALTF